jgi:hypothetical protein
MGLICSCHFRRLSERRRSTSEFKQPQPSIIISPGRHSQKRLSILTTFESADLAGERRGDMRGRRSRASEKPTNGDPLALSTVLLRQLSGKLTH